MKSFDSMAKINLLTIHWGCSYGGTMQTYATIKTLRQLGHKVVLINLIHPKTNNLFRNIRSISLFIRIVQFSLFRYFYFGKTTNKMFSIEEKYLPKADYTIVGSDQVWNSDITTSLKASYFLDFVSEGQKLSYASSFGKSDWIEDENYTNYIKKQLDEFKAVSVREESGLQICKNVFGIPAIQVIDPTLMHRNYDELIKSNKPIHEIFPFLLAKTNNSKYICELVSHKLGIPLYSRNRIRNYFGRSPKEWLRRMKNSSYIITDSFHGLAFSIIFHKQFLVVCADVRKFTRLQSLLSLLHLEERFIKSPEDLANRIDIIQKVVDYNIIDSILDSERKKSLSFLNNNLK